MLLGDEGCPIDREKESQRFHCSLTVTPAITILDPS